MAVNRMEKINRDIPKKTVDVNIILKSIQRESCVNL
jgi:hypothetical protein